VSIILAIPPRDHSRSVGLAHYPSTVPERSEVYLFSRELDDISGTVPGFRLGVG